MADITVEMAGYQISEDPNSSLVTYALGSCIAVMLHDPTRKVGGMIHYMLPLSSTSPERAASHPAMFADTGVPLLFEEMYRHRCKKQDLIVKVAGGGLINDERSVFDIGRRNYTILRKLLWKSGVIITAESVGGQTSRTARMDVSTGNVTIKTQMGEISL